MYAQPETPDQSAPRVFSCDPLLTALFTPRHPQVGRYEVCTSPDSIAVVTTNRGPDAPHYSPIETRDALDVFGLAGTYDRSKLGQLYAGQRPRVVYGWSQTDERFESVTLISPYPDATLTRLLPGTMVIRLTIRNNLTRP